MTSILSILKDVKYWVIVALLAGGLSSLKSEELRVLNWNLKWFPGQGPSDEPALAKDHMAEAQWALAQINPDVILLQEVKTYEAAVELCKVLPDFSVHVVSRFPQRAQQLVIASRFPAYAAWFEEFPKEDELDPPRGFSFASIGLPGEQRIGFYSVHLKSNLGDPTECAALREEGAKQLLNHELELKKILKDQQLRGVVIGGDFNTSLDTEKFKSEKTLSFFTETGWWWTHTGIPFSERITIPSEGRYPDDCFDHVFTKDLQKPAARVLDYRGISDHEPILVTINIPDVSWKREEPLTLYKANGKSRLNINKATEKELSALPGMDESKAKQLIKMRPFYSITDVERVNGIGNSTLKIIRPLITTISD